MKETCFVVLRDDKIFPPYACVCSKKTDCFIIRFFSLIQFQFLWLYS